ncbi:MAG TPA: response regulator [Anaerolineae bacterium]|jgi:CheY-like chemotaxis protein
MNNQRFNILMAEDNEHDIIAARRAWQKNKIANPLHIVNDGEACLDYLYQRGAFSEPGSAPPPGILLLDLNMPKMDGLTLLKRIRADNVLRRLPVIILTTSQLEEDRAKSYELGANAYIKKPIGFEPFSDAVKIINRFWELAELPE